MLGEQFCYNLKSFYAVSSFCLLVPSTLPFILEFLIFVVLSPVLGIPWK